MSKNVYVPSVSKILSFFGDSEALQQWANKIGLVDRKSLNEVSQFYKDVGILTHKKIELYTLSEDKKSFKLEKDLKRLDEEYKKTVCYNASIAFSNFKKCYNENKIIQNLEIIFNEKKIIHDKLKFVGIMDTYGKYKDKYYLIDYKTSSKIRYDYCFQLAAYSLLLEQENYKIDKYMILRLDKNNLVYDILEKKNLDKEKKIFKCMLKLYKIINNYEYNFMK